MRMSTWNGSKTARAATAALLAAALISLPPLAGAATVGDAVADAGLHLKVRIALLEKLGFDALGIGIETNAASGTVALSGEVEDRASRELAPEIARSVEGVEAVDSDLTVATPREGIEARERSEAEAEVGDALLEARAKAALVGEIGTNAFEVEIETADGVVTVRGTLDSDHVHDAAIATLEGVEGVTEVVDLVDVG